MASNKYNLNTWGAKRIFGDNQSQNPAGALLQSGAGRADNSTTGDTWIFWDTIGGTGSPWGIRHNQGANTISLIGGGTTGSWVNMNTGNSYFRGNMGIGTESPSYKLHVEGTTYVNSAILGSLASNYKTITVGGDAATYYPVMIGSPSDYYPAVLVSITRTYSETAPDSWNTSTHKGGLTCTFLWNCSRYWDGNGAGGGDSIELLRLQESYCTMVGKIGNSTAGLVVWLRGGGANYHVFAPRGVHLSVTVYTSTYTDSASQQFAPITTVDVANKESYRRLHVKADSAVHDGSGNTITSKYVTLDTTQTITGLKHFTGNLQWGTSDQGGILYGNATNGGLNSMRIGDDIYLGDCNVSGILGLKSTATNCGFYFHNSSGTQTGQFYNNGSNFYMNKLLLINTNSNTLTLGSTNSGFCHITSSANIPFWFNRSILMEHGNTIGAAGTAYRPFQLYLGRHATSGSNALDANNPLIEFSNSDRSQYCQLIYDDYDSLQAPDSLTLVGNQNGITFICKNGPIWIQGGSNAGGNVNRLNTSGGMPGNMQYNTSRRGTQIYSNGIAFCDPYNGNNNSDSGWIRHIETSGNNGELEIAVGDDGVEVIALRQYNTSNAIAHQAYLDSAGRFNFANANNSSYNYDSAAIWIREAGYTGSGSDTWGQAPRLGWHWSGRVAAQIGLASNGWLYEAPVTGTNFYRIVCENGGTYNIVANPSSHTHPVSQITWGAGQNLTCSGDNTEWSIDMNGAGSYWHVWSGTQGTTLACYRDTGHVNIPHHLYVGGYNNTSYGLSASTIACSGNLWVSANNATGGGIILADDGDIVDNNDGYCSMRFSYGVRIFSANRGGSAVITLGSNGNITANAVHNAVWNDYAECRQAEIIEGGYCVTENKNGYMIKTTQRLMPACKLTSDTYGSIMGETEEAKTPIAVAGRVLVYTYQSRENYELGDAVCSAPNGTVDIMTREEIMMYPERIVGTVSEIPDYEIWHGGGKYAPQDIEVNGRIWVYVR